ncbi:hypothetical protein ACNSTU_17165 [Aquisalimonas sp. APHAB1-3]|uniref:hypothetical protein n=1 Tax=Aquisalimonas sp. APHAB1-3 TaxID=3402080 RepID=UPI003AAB1101
MITRRKQFLRGAGVIGTGLCSVILAGCLSDSSDPDGGDVNSVEISGVAVDGYIAGARVYVDLNDNNRRDSFEPRAFTDSYGFFSQRPDIRDGNGELVAEARDYCAEGIERHCLTVSTAQSQARLRVEGGYDLFSGEAFQGSLSRLIEIQNSSSGTVLPVSPVTSLSNNIVFSTDDVDPWGDHLEDAQYSERDSVAAVAIHETVTAVSDELFGGLDSDDLQAEATGLMYDGLRTHADGQQGDLRDAVDDLDASDFQGAIDDALADQDVDVEKDTVDEVVELATTLLDTLLDDGDSGSSGTMALASTTSLNEADDGEPRDRGEARVQAILSYTRSDQARSPDTDDAQTIDELSEILAEGGQDSRRSIDIDSLSRRLWNEGGDPEASVSASEVENTFPALAGKYVAFATDADSDKDGEAALFFDGESGDRSGELSLCVRGDLEDVDLSAFGDDGTVLITGQWDQPNDRTLILSLSALGGSVEESAILRLRSTADTDSDWAFGLEFDGDRENFEVDGNEADVFRAIGDEGAPTDESACADADFETNTNF